MNGAGQYYYESPENGSALTGWQQIDDTWYYFNGNGIMQTNRTTPDGYWVNGSGVLSVKESY